jgi:hypothetical protein
MAKWGNGSGEPSAYPGGLQMLDQLAYRESSLGATSASSRPAQS